jgi:2-polyprenyl-3-methyl-5-hydroxy-6-metoxy-1,4-benzoquinol methylase
MTTYAFRNDARERLVGIETTWDGKTIRHLEALGVGPGWRCLEVGAGGGTIAEWLARRVAPDGDVLAVDLDTQFVDRVEAPNLETRNLDIRTHDLPHESFDLVHARLLLSHVHASNALERMLAALAPGGVILLEDFDYDRAGGLFPPHPLTLRAVDAVLSEIEIGGWNRSFGSELYRRLTAASLQDVAAEGTCFLVPGGTEPTAVERLTFEVLRQPLVARGALSEDEVDEAIALLDDPRSCVMTGLMVAAWGTKPAARPTTPVATVAS